MKIVLRFVLATILALCFLCFSLTPIIVASADTKSSYTNASSMVVLEASSKRVLEQKNMDEKRAMASTTKIATAITVIENCDDIYREVVIPKCAEGVEGTSLYLKEGEKLTIKELLYGLMLISGNDAAVALACTIGGSVEGFCEMMNNVAKKCGANSTNFANPHGLDDINHYTTAYDLALITAYALENPVFSEIVSSKEAKIGGDENGYRYLKNKNKLLSSLSGCIGVKTGYTSKAGRCLVSAVEREGMKVVCVVFNCGPMFEESSTLLDNAFANYKMFTLLEPYNIIKRIPVIGGVVEDVKVYSANGFSYPLTNEEYIKIDYKYELPENIVAPEKKEKIIGKVKIYFNNDLLFETNIYTMDNVDMFETSDGLKKIIEDWTKG